MTINEILVQIYPLQPHLLSVIANCVQEKNIAKGEIILNQNHLAHKLFFIKKGIVRAYIQTPKKEVTFWFGKEGEPVVSIKSYVMNQRSYETVEAIEDTIVYELSIKQLHDFYNQHIEIANWGRKFVEKELIKTEERLIALQFQSATERYKNLLINAPEMIHRIPLGYLASYLGMTQVSLSRIRAGIKNI